MHTGRPLRPEDIDRILEHKLAIKEPLKAGCYLLPDGSILEVTMDQSSKEYKQHMREVFKSIRKQVQDEGSRFSKKTD